MHASSAKMDFIDSIRCFLDTIWEINLRTRKVYVWHENATGPGSGHTLDYDELFRSYLENYIYPPDRDIWLNNFTVDKLKDFIASENGTRKLEVRLGGTDRLLEWNDISLHPLTDEDGNRDIVMVYGRVIDDAQREHIVATAVESDYDYIVYIEVNTDSYILFSDPSRHTMLPPATGNNYSAEIIKYARSYCPGDSIDYIVENMSYETILPIVQEKGEHIFYTYVFEEDGKPYYKKLRYSWYDKEKNILLLTRTDVTAAREEERQKELLQHALETANIANRAKTEFLSRMSHDIRTPLNAVIGMTAIAAAHIDDRERVFDCLGKITTSSRHLLGLINEVLDMSKIESGKLSLSEEEFHLGDLVRGVLTMIRQDMDRKGHNLISRLNQLTHEAIIGDPLRLQQVLNNILGNAVKYTPNGGSIVFEITEKPSRFRGHACFEFTVSDNGIGMKPDFMPKLFEPFERAEDDAVRRVQGTGLGMVICKNFAQMMNGDIQVSSEYGRGSTFTITVHLKLQNPKDDACDELVNLPVLIADDDRIVCENTCLILNDLGMESHWVTTGAEAVERVTKAHEEERDFFVAIIDLKMAHMDGIETTRAIRAKVGPGVPIIIISAYDWTEYEAEAREAGANAFLAKPLFRSTLLTGLKKFVGYDAAKAEPMPAVNNDFTGKRILIVEDNALNMEIARELLMRTGAILDEAEDGRAAVDMVARSPENYYNLILMDVQMPVMDGYQATTAIRALPRPDAGALPIVAMTANAFADDVQAALRAGMNQHLAKPIDIAALMDILRRWIK